MITAKQANSEVEKKKKADVKAARAKADAEVERLIVDEEFARSQISAELKNIEKKIKEEIKNGKTSVLYFVTLNDYAGRCLTHFLVPRLLELGFKANMSSEHVPGYDGAYDEQSWSAYDSYRIEISW